MVGARKSERMDVETHAGVFHKKDPTDYGSFPEASEETKSDQVSGHGLREGGEGAPPRAPNDR